MESNKNSANELSALYGLPAEVKYCKSCTISNQRPNSTVEYKHTKKSKKETIVFDAEGICDACRSIKRKDLDVDWIEREQKLRVLCDKYRSTDGSYDCLVPGSGGKDSFFQAHKLKYEYGMSPLTITWAPHIYTDWGWRNFNRWIHSGFDNFKMTPNGRVHRLLTRIAVERLFHPFQPFIIGQKALAPKLALQFNIPLVFYGENEAEYGNPIANNDTAIRDFEYFTNQNEADIYLAGASIQELKDDFELSQNDLKAYLPSSPEALISKGVEVHYLGYYLKWHPQGAYYYAHEHGGFEASPERSAGTYSKYNSIDDKIDDFHYYTTFIKFGIGRATYDSSQEIRHGEIDREEGIALIRRYDGEFPERFATELFEYLSIRESDFPKASKQFESPIVNFEYFDKLSDQFRSPHLWKNVNGTWALSHPIWQDV